MALIGSRERQACPSCGRTWERRAAFCGACGDRLEGALPGGAESTASGADLQRESTTRRTVASIVAVVALVAAVGGVALVVQSPSAVSGDVGVPEADAVSTMAPDDPLAPPPPPPEVTCRDDDGPIACVAWMRPVSPAAEDAYAVTSDDAVVVSWQGRRGDAGVTVLDAITGERRWSHSLAIEHFGVVAGDGVVLTPGATEVHALSLDTGEEMWTAPTSGRLHGTLLHAGLAFTHRDASDDGAHSLEARTADDGALAWSWALPDSVRRTDHLSIGRVDEHRVLVSTFEGTLLSIVDVGTGIPVWTADVPERPWGVVGDVVLEVALPDGDPSGPNPAGDPGATLTARSVADGTVQWERDVRASNVSFGRTGDLVLAPSTGLLTAIDLSTGEIRWETETEEHESLAWIPDAATSRVPPPPSSALVVTTGQLSGLLRGRDPGNGEVVWERDLGSGRGGFLQAALLGDRLVAITASGVTYLDPTSGEVRVEVLGSSLRPVLGATPLLVGPRGHVIRVDLGGREDG